jgi:predicted small secreted protein
VSRSRYRAAIAPAACDLSRVRRITLKQLIALCLALLALPTLSACNTMRGIGQDIERGGAAIERAATR